MSGPFKMKGWGGFQNSPLKQDEDKKKEKKESIVSLGDVDIFDSDTTHYRTNKLYSPGFVNYLKREGLSAEEIKALAERNDRIFKAGKAKAQKGTDEER